MSTRATKVTLRPLADDDLTAVFEFCRDPIAVQMAAFISRNPDDHEAFLQFWAKLRSNPNNIVQAVLADGEFAGTVGSYPSEGKQEVTYWIGRPFWGRGIASAALALFIRNHCVLPLRARVAADNLGSIRVLQKTGFVIIDQDRGFANARGEEIDELVLELRESAQPE